MGSINPVIKNSVWYFHFQRLNGYLSTVMGALCNLDKQKSYGFRFDICPASFRYKLNVLFKTGVTGNLPKSFFVEQRTNPQRWYLGRICQLSKMNGGFSSFKCSRYPALGTGPNTLQWRNFVTSRIKKVGIHFERAFWKPLLLNIVPTVTMLILDSFFTKEYLFGYSHNKYIESALFFLQQNKCHNLYQL